ncbi:MAG: hypothetical protein ACD_11C00110G0013 [uncultured bacterium]|nr:MAG: hypothetical protein ACD_11C00110G0013 [uncultured bacterium]
MLGFSTGCLYKTLNGLEKETISIFGGMGCDAIEIMWHNADDDLTKVLEMDDEFWKQFKSISLHIPSLDAYSDVKIASLLETVVQVHNKIHFDMIVLHPYEAMNWDIFRQFDLPFAIENMDWRKDFGKYTDSLKDIFSKFDVSMVLDLNHCYSNDPSMKLAEELLDVFGDRIKKIHLSGFGTYHDPLYRTKQEEILKAIPDKNLPIIIESVCDTVEEIKEEFEYVKSYLEKRNQQKETEAENPIK